MTISAVLMQKFVDLCTKLNLEIVPQYLVGTDVLPYAGLDRKYGMVEVFINQHGMLVGRNEIDEWADLSKSDHAIGASCYKGYARSVYGVRTGTPSTLEELSEEEQAAWEDAGLTVLQEFEMKLRK